MQFMHALARSALVLLLLLLLLRLYLAVVATSRPILTCMQSVPWQLVHVLGILVLC